MLAALDEAMRPRGRRYATAILARVEADGGGRRTLRWSNAGHPPPVLIGPTAARGCSTTGPDPLLGLAEDVRRTDHALDARAGLDAWCFYTDGLVERRDPVTGRGIA